MISFLSLAESMVAVGVGRTGNGAAIGAGAVAAATGAAAAVGRGAATGAGDTYAGWAGAGRMAEAGLGALCVLADAKMLLSAAEAASGGGAAATGAPG